MMMSSFTLAELAQAISAVVHLNDTAADVAENISAQRINTDTRNLKQGDVFLALRGEHFDGHDYLQTALDNGAAAAIIDETYFKELLLLNDDSGAKHLLKKYKYHVKVLIPPTKNVDLDFKKDYLKLYKTYFKK